jgi:hypothetical protein
MEVVTCRDHQETKVDQSATRNSKQMGQWWEQQQLVIYSILTIHTWALCNLVKCQMVWIVNAIPVLNCPILFNSRIYLLDNSQRSADCLLFWTLIEFYVLHNRNLEAFILVHLCVMHLLQFGFSIIFHELIDVYRLRFDKIYCFHYFDYLLILSLHYLIQCIQIHLRLMIPNQLFV